MFPDPLVTGKQCVMLHLDLIEIAVVGFTSLMSMQEWQNHEVV